MVNSLSRPYQTEYLRSRLIPNEQNIFKALSDEKSHSLSLTFKQSIGSNSCTHANPLYPRTINSFVQRHSNRCFLQKSVVIYVIFLKAPSLIIVVISFA